jgi:hypothetical protein
MENISVASVLGVGTVNLKLTSRNILHLKNMQHAPTINRNMINVSLLCQDDYKLVFELNKVVISIFGKFVGKGYVSGRLFLLSTSDYSYNLNIASMSNNKICEADVRHSRFVIMGLTPLLECSAYN